MASITRLHGDWPPIAAAPDGAGAAEGIDWQPVVRAAAGWLREAGIGGAGAHEAIVLLPGTQHLPLARCAWAGTGGWLPRIETPQTLAAALAPPWAAAAGEVSFDTANDRLTARRLLTSRAGGADWARRDPRGHAHAVGRLVEAAQALARAAATVPPGLRDAWWQQARALLGPVQGPGAAERSLAQVALEWAAASGVPPVTDRLFALRPAAWIAVRAGGADRLVERLLEDAADAGVPCAVVDADAVPADPFAAFASAYGCGQRVSLAVCDGFEAEAQAAAAQVLAHLARGERPVVLVAQDRALVRRVRALLERQRVPLADETGWRLSTTRAGACVMSLLRAADREALSDAWLDWLKNLPPSRPDALPALEAQLRRRRWTRPQAVNEALLDEAAAALWRAARGVIAAFVRLPRRTLGGWLGALDAALDAAGARAALAADAAGAQVLAALGLDDPSAAGPAWQANREQAVLDVDDFRDWVDAVLDAALFVPELPDGAVPAVVVTPLARALLRPFAAAVLPGCDEQRLGAAGDAPALIGEALAVELGVPGRAALREAQALAFAQLLRLPRVTLLRRRVDGRDPLAPSPLVEQLRLAVALGTGGGMDGWADPRSTCTVAARPVARPAPAVPTALLPTRLDLHACEALRACPYRFFALHVLGARDADELDDALGKRDYGGWLHAVLDDFHRGRTAPTCAADEVARLRAVGQGVRARRGLREDDFLPFAATFERLAPRYVAWLHRRDAEGACWQEGERTLAIRPAALGGVELHGRIDRVDRLEGARGDGGATQLIDHQTVAAHALRDVLKRPQEDTGLAFRAALLLGDGLGGDEDDAAAAPLRAVYLALDERDGVTVLEHAGVAASARRLVDGLADDLMRLRDGAGLPAHGEGALCGRCEVRGLCRRDHWTAA